VKSRIALPVLLLLGTLPSFLPAQALEGRNHPEQLALVRNAVLAGRLPPFDTWPQPAAAVPDSEATTGSSDFEAALGAGGRVNGQDYWDQYLFRRGSENPLALWTVHAETKGQWGLLLHADYYSTTPGWHATNVILPDSVSPFPMESHFLTQSWLWYDFHPLQIEIGRDQVHWGPLDNSLLVSDAVPFLDMIRGTIAGGPWTLDWIISTPETRTNGGGNDVLYVELLNLHRLEYRTENWRWSFSEKYIVRRGTPTGPFVLADYFPVGVFHNADVNPNNNCLNFDGEWVPAAGFRVMGQLGFDDVDGRIFGIPDNPIPTIWAFLLGTEWQGTWDDAPVRLYGEVGMTHYLWGNYSDPQARALYLVALDRRTESMPLSAPYGPGTAWINLSARWSQGPLSLSGKFELFDTKDGVNADTPYAYNWALEGLGSSADERLSLQGRWQFDPIWALTLEPVQTYHQGTIGLEAQATLDWKP
jgi:hypothetical protein